MELKSLFRRLANLFNGDLKIEKVASQELQSQAPMAMLNDKGDQLAEPYQKVMCQHNAHPICSDILKIPFNWSPPKTSTDKLYQKHSVFKSHVELLGPDGLLKSDVVRLGLYGMLPASEYGIRTHPAEEIYIMLAGDCLWKRGADIYRSLTANERSHHPSYLPHATKTQSNAFMSVYVWIGDLSKDQYSYKGLPESSEIQN